MKSIIKLPDLSGKNVLVTGGLGFIGSNIAHECLKLGAKVTIYDCLDPRSGGNIFNIKSIKSNISLVLNDIRNFEGVSAAVVDQDIIFTCAAYTSHPNSMKEPFVDIDVNCKGMTNILEATKRFNKYAKIVHVGTSTQIGCMISNPVTETHSEFPVDIYSANKVASEKYVLIYGKAYGMRTTVVRLANNFGPRSNIKSPDFGFMNYFIGLGLKNKDICVFGEGNQLRNVSYIGDSVAALILAAESEESNGQVFFGASDNQHTVGEIAEAISRVIGGSVKKVPWPKDREAIEIGDAVISNSKIKSALNWESKFDLETGLAHTADYYRDVINEYLD
jgi:UDP-glucose 4-epimerase